MTKSVTKIQDKDSLRRLSVVRSTEDPTKYGVVILNPDGSKIKGPQGDKGDTGVGICCIVFNPDYTVTVETTDGCCYTSGCIRGAQGDKGDTGNAATITVGCTTTGNAGTCASVSNSGTQYNAVFDFTIPKGDKGDTGSAATVSVGTTSTLLPGCSATVNNSGTSGAAVFNFGIPKGEKGDTGTAATINVGTTTTLQPGCSATVSNSGTTSTAVFNFGIPKGEKGDTGACATVNVGNTTTGNPGTSASVTNSGTSTNAIFNFTIPRGDKGDTGNGISNVTSTKAGKVTTVDITCTNGCSYCFDVCDGQDGEGAGDVLGPSSSVGGNVVLFDGTSGKLIKDSGKTLPNVIDSLCCASTTDALSANQGKELKDLIDTYAGLGRFLSLWDATTGQPMTFPLDIPYIYKTGDWYMVEVVGTTNYKPDGSSYTGSASTVVDSVNNVEVRDVYIYDGTTWLFQKNNETQVSFSDIAGEPSDNVCLGAALGGKQDVLTAGANINITSNKIKANNVYTIKESDACTTYTGTLGVSPYNSCYCYTNICINPDSGVEWHEGGIYSFDINTGMVATSACRNVRVKIGSGEYIPVMGTSSILAGCAYFTKANMRQYMYSTKYIGTGALHMFSDSNTTYSAMSTTEIDGGTCTSNRVISSANLKYAINKYAPISSSSYGAGWCNSTCAPTQGAVYTKIEAVVSSIPTDNCQLANSCGYTTCTGTLVASDLNNYAKCCDIPTNNNQLANGCGYTTCTGTLSSCSDVISALGYTPYNSSNPNGYTSCTGTLTAETVYSGDSGTSYAIKVAASAPSGATNTTITFVK